MKKFYIFKCPCCGRWHNVHTAYNGTAVARCRLDGNNFLLVRSDKRAVIRTLKRNGVQVAILPLLKWQKCHKEIGGYFADYNGIRYLILPSLILKNRFFVANAEVEITSLRDTLSECKDVCEEHARKELYDRHPL